MRSAGGVLTSLELGIYKKKEKENHIKQTSRMQARDGQGSPSACDVSPGMMVVAGACSIPTRVVAHGGMSSTFGS